METVILISTLILLVEHWFPWRLAMGKELPRIPSYTVGVLAFIVPISVWWWQLGESNRVIQLWIVVVGSGSATCLAYGIDWLLGRIAQARDLETLEDLYHGRGPTKSSEE